MENKEEKSEQTKNQTSDEQSNKKRKITNIIDDKPNIMKFRCSECGILVDSKYSKCPNEICENVICFECKDYLRKKFECLTCKQPICVECRITMVSQKRISDFCGEYCKFKHEFENSKLNNSMFIINGANFGANGHNL
jgi:hypothetical protein